jgi:hypothetical protein
VELGLNPEHMKPIKLNYEGQTITKFDGLDEYLVNQVVAEEMRICWFEFGEGKIKVMVNDNNPFAGKNVCFLCSEIQFEDGVKIEEFKGLIDYLENTKYDDTKTYYEYFNQDSISKDTWENYINDEDNPAKMTDIVLNKTKTYGVVFIRDQRFLSKDGYYVELVELSPNRTINKVCDIQAS